MTEEEVTRLSKLPGMEKAVLIGNVERRELYYPAIIAVDIDKGVFIYDHDLLAECFAEEFQEHDMAHGILKQHDHYLQEAIEWIDFNVLRSLPYYGEHAPLISITDEEGNQVIYNKDNSNYQSMEEDAPMTSTERIERLAKRLSEQETVTKQLTEAMGKLTEAIDLLRKSNGEDNEDDRQDDRSEEERGLTNARDNALQEILDNFDYERVVKVCQFLEWKVADRKNASDHCDITFMPMTEVTEELLRRDTIKKAQDAWHAFDTGETDEEWTVHSGPLKLWWCECDDGIFAELTFVCEDWRVEPA